MSILKGFPSNDLMFKKKNDSILRQKLPDVKDWFQSYALLNLMKLFLKFLNEKKIEIHTLSVWFLKQNLKDSTDL